MEIGFLIGEIQVNINGLFVFLGMFLGCILIATMTAATILRVLISQKKNMQKIVKLNLKIFG